MLVDGVSNVMLALLPEWCRYAVRCARPLARARLPARGLDNRSGAPQVIRLSEASATHTLLGYAADDATLVPPVR
ncbi:MAG: hypothetical protein ABW022_15925 [Actinoplanes sp.]